MNGQPTAFPEAAAEQVIEKLEDAAALMVRALRQGVADSQAKDAGAIEYDSWAPPSAGAIEYDSWTAHA